MADTNSEIFSDFCNICCKTEKQQLINISDKSNYLKDTLFSLTGCSGILEEKEIYLCLSCCEFLASCHRFKQMCLSNLIKVRKLYFEITKLELEKNEPGAKMLQGTLHAEMLKSIDNMKHNRTRTMSQEVNKNDQNIILIHEMENAQNELRKQVQNDEDAAIILSDTEAGFGNENDSDVRHNTETNMPTDCDTNPEGMLHIENNHLLKTDKCETPYTDYFNDVDMEPIYVSDDSKDLEEDHETVSVKSGSTSDSDHAECTNLKEELPEPNISKRNTPRTVLYECDWPGCGKIFQTAFKFNQHKFYHTEMKVRPYACDWPGCDWKFIRKHHLRRHVRKHTADKPYQCLDCGRKFSRSDHMYHHRKTVHLRN